MMVGATRGLFVNYFAGYERVGKFTCPSNNQIAGEAEFSSTLQ
jgi:hypothetical protein